MIIKELYLRFPFYSCVLQTGELEICLLPFQFNTAMEVFYGRKVEAVRSAQLGHVIYGLVDARIPVNLAPSA